VVAWATLTVVIGVAFGVLLSTIAGTRTSGWFRRDRQRIDRAMG
jgi:hypothetical protein